jgi:hypothetical protein
VTPHYSQSVDVAFDPDTGTYRACFDWSSRTPSVGIAMVLHALCDDPSRVDPLADSVDPVSLNSLLECEESTTCGDDLEVTFAHDGFHVTADQSGVVRVRPGSAAESSASDAS